MSVDVLETEGSLTIGKTQRLFESDPNPGGLGPMYDASADGKKFVVVTGSDAEAAKPLTLILNWPALLDRR